MKNVVLNFEIESNLILITASLDGISFVTYFIESKQSCTSRGALLCKTTLASYAINELLNCDVLNLEQEIWSDNQVNYLSAIHKLHISHYKEINGDSPSPILAFGKTENMQYSVISLNENNCYIGYTGGKDSTLALSLCKERYSDVSNFFVNFDADPFTGNYRIGRKIISDEIFSGVSTQTWFEQCGLLYYQENDMHILFSSSYFSVQDNSPAHLIVGIPFDNLSPYCTLKGNTFSEYVVSESIIATKIFINFVHTIGMPSFKVISPVCSLTSFGIYSALALDIGGMESVRNLSSCWNPESDNEPCGKCLKCQRLNIIFSILSDPAKDIRSHSELAYLFGSFVIQDWLKGSKEERKKLFEVHVPSELSEIDADFHKILMRRYGFQLSTNCKVSFPSLRSE